MNEKPGDKQGEEKAAAGSDNSDSDNEAKQGTPTVVSLKEKVDALFGASRTNADGALAVKEAKPMLLKLGADLLGTDESSAAEVLEKFCEELESKNEGFISKDELHEKLKQLEQE